MKSLKLLKLLFVLSAASLLLPWFTYNFKMTGFCWGWEFLKFMLIPCIITGLWLFKRPESRCMGILALISMVINAGIVLAAPGCWQIMHNITGSFLYRAGLSTALPTFYAAAALHLLLPILSCIPGPCSLFKGAGNTPR